MEIGIDIQSTLGEKTGLGSYTVNLVKNLQKIDTRNKYLFFSSNKKKDLRTYERLYWDQIGLPVQAKKSKIDLLHCPGFSAPLLRSCPIILTLHDLITVHFPKNVSSTAALYWKHFLPYTAKYVNRIVTDSEYSKNDIISILKIREEKIDVVYPGVDERYRIIENTEKIDKTLEKYNLPKKYILFVSSLEPRKNIGDLIKAYHLLQKSTGVPHKLVIVGKKTKHFFELQYLVEKLAIEKQVIFTGYVSDEELPYLYNSAELFVFPSLFEGFGLTPLEAMACGVPVICANRTSLPEIIDDGGILFSPNDITGLKDIIEKVLTDNELRKNLRGKGINRSKQFSYENTANRMIKVYEKTVSE